MPTTWPLSFTATARLRLEAPARTRRTIHPPAAESAEIDHPAGRRPREGMKIKIASGITPADDLATVVHGHGPAVEATEGAEIDHPARRRPGEGTRRAIADDLAVGVHCQGL